MKNQKDCLSIEENLIDSFIERLEALLKVHNESEKNKASKLSVVLPKACKSGSDYDITKQLIKLKQIVIEWEQAHQDFEANSAKQLRKREDALKAFNKAVKNLDSVAISTIAGDMYRQSTNDMDAAESVSYTHLTLPTKA